MVKWDGIEDLKSVLSVEDMLITKETNFLVFAKFLENLQSTMRKPLIRNMYTLYTRVEFPVTVDAILRKLWHLICDHFYGKKTVCNSLCH